MKIAFCGAHGVGKTTIVQDLTPYCPDLKIYDGVGRKIITKKQNWSRRRTQRYFNWHFATYHFFTKNFITSRTIYDTWAYSRLTVDPWFNYRLHNWCIKSIYYDYVFYLPIEFPLEFDGIRYEGEEFQAQVDKEIKMILDFFHIPYHTITGSHSERLSKVLYMIGKK
jgi:hypothetical protein